MGFFRFRGVSGTSWGFLGHPGVFWGLLESSGGVLGLPGYLLGVLGSPGASLELSWVPRGFLMPLVYERHFANSSENKPLFVTRCFDTVSERSRKTDKCMLVFAFSNVSRRACAFFQNIVLRHLRCSVCTDAIWQTILGGFLRSILSAFRHICLITFRLLARGVLRI